MTPPSPTATSTSALPAPPCAESDDGDRWFVEEVHPHRSQLRSYLHRAFPSVRDVDDVVQESFLRIWRTRTRQPIRSVKGCLFTIARRLAIDLVRRNRRSPFVAVRDVRQLFIVDRSAEVREVANRETQINLLIEAVESLPARCREIFILCQFEGLPQKEVAARLGLAEGTVAVQSARGLHRCEAYVRERIRK